MRACHVRETNRKTPFNKPFNKLGNFHIHIYTHHPYTLTPYSVHSPTGTYTHPPRTHAPTGTYAHPQVHTCTRYACIYNVSTHTNTPPPVTAQHSPPVTPTAQHTCYYSSTRMLTCHTNSSTLNTAEPITSQNQYITGIGLAVTLYDKRRASSHLPKPILNTPRSAAEYHHTCLYSMPHALAE